MGSNNQGQYDDGQGNGGHQYDQNQMEVNLIKIPKMPFYALGSAAPTEEELKNAQKKN